MYRPIDFIFKYRNNTRSKQDKDRFYIEIFVILRYACKLLWFFSKNLTGLRKGIQIEASCWHGKHYNIHVCPQSLNDLIYTNQWGMFGTNYQILCFFPCHFCGIRCVTISFIFWFFTYSKTSTMGSSEWCSLNPHDCFETLALPILSTHSWKDS